MEGLCLVIATVRLLTLLFSPLSLAHHCCHNDADEKEKENCENNTGDNPDPDREAVGLWKRKGLNIKCHC